MIRKPCIAVLRKRAAPEVIIHFVTPLLYDSGREVVIEAIWAIAQASTRSSVEILRNCLAAWQAHDSINAGAATRALQKLEKAELS